MANVSGGAFTIRRKYVAGGDVWLEDAMDRNAALERAREHSRTFEHGAVYAVIRKGAKAEVIGCYVLGYVSHFNWWIAPTILSFRKPQHVT